MRACFYDRIAASRRTTLIKRAPSHAHAIPDDGS